MDYKTFLHGKTQFGADAGFEPVFMPDFLFDFQRKLVDWAVRKGRAAIFADCGLGKTPMQLVWAQNVHKHTGKRVLVLTPLAVGQQTVREAHKFGIDAEQSRDGKMSAPVVVTNYEKLHLFKPDDFGGVVCDESSILKSFGGATRKRVTRFMSKMHHRLLCTATAAPNDYVELGTSSEALGELNHSEMLKRFFKYLDDKGQKSEGRQQAEAEKMQEAGASYFQKLAYRVAQTIGQWRLKHHAVQHFWRWVASWSRAIRKPSDLGCDDAAFKLPELIERDHMVKAKTLRPGMLFDLPAFGLGEEREERKRTLKERCELAAKLADNGESTVIWCHANAEGDLLEEIVSGAQQIAGATPDERKIELYEAFASGELRTLVIKPKIGAWGLNWQHCSNVITFASHSYEQYYQSVRRCWRFGQKKAVTVDMIATEGEVRVLANMRKKAARADAMFAQLVQEMNNATRIERVNNYTKKETVPSWLLQNKKSAKTSQPTMQTA